MKENKTQSPVQVKDQVAEIKNFRHEYTVTEVNTESLTIRMVDNTTGTPAKVSFGSFGAFFKKL